MRARNSISLIAILAVLSGSPAICDDEIPPGDAVPASDERQAGAETQPSAEQIARLITQLDSDSYADREQATRELIALGSPIVEPLSKAMDKASLEVAVRAVRVLEALYASDDAKAIDASELALERLQTVKNNSVAMRADLVLLKHDDVRQKRAVAKIRELGGTIKYLDERLQPVLLPANQFGDDEHRVEYLILGGDWKGGDEGLKYVHRLNDLTTLIVVDGSGVSEKALETLQTTFANLTIDRRRPAYLGVKISETDNGCRILQVTDGSAAEKAGLQANDVVVRFADKPIENTAELIELIGAQKPGEKVPVIIERLNEMIELEVEMGTW